MSTEQAGAALRPPVKPSRMRKLAAAYGVGRRFGARVLIFTPDDVATIQRERRKRGQKRTVAR